VYNLVIKILTAVIVLVDLYKCIIKEYYGSNAHLPFEWLFKNKLLLFDTMIHPFKPEDKYFKKKKQLILNLLLNIKIL
jgi:hypothetical protein